MSGTSGHRPCASRKWPGWRGPKELLVHTARAIEFEIISETGQAPICQIDLAVDTDCEEFHSVNDFKENVTTDGLKRFRRLEICIDSETVRSSLLLEWLVNRYRPVRGDDARVMLHVDGDNQTNVDAVMDRAVGAVLRGTKHVDRVQNLSAYSIGFVLGSVVWIAGALIIYLIGGSWVDNIWQLGLLGFLVGLPLGVLTHAWMFPSIEVAEPSQLNIVRTLKVVGSLLASLAIAGLGKYLFG